MQRTVLTLILFICFVGLQASPAGAFLFGDDTLVSIDDTDYSTEDFRQWWKFWQEGDTPLPETPAPYIDFLLLGQEAKRMDFHNDPGFERQTRIFLQSRTLLMLKYEAVDSKIDVTDAEIRARYEEKYVPIWVVQRFEFEDQKAAMEAWRMLTAGEATIDEIIARDPEQNGPVATAETHLRPRGIDPGWEEIFENLAEGSVADPDLHGKGKFLYYLKEKNLGSDEDFARFKEGLAKDLWKEEEDVLTRQLLRDLREKYEVKINEERIDALDVNANLETFSDEPVITTSKQDFSEKEFMAVVKRIMANRSTAAHKSTDEETAQALKDETIANVLAQSLTNWESIERHFEEKEPFKWEYEFNYDYRLTQMVEQRLFAPKAEVTDEEVRTYYEENASRYAQPTIVKLYIIDETQGPIDKIWADVAVGNNFIQVLNQYMERTVSPQEVPANHLDPEVKPVVAKLVDGETSQIFKAQGDRVMVHLVERTPGRSMPLERVEDLIRALLKREKVGQVRAEYLEALRSQSDIEINQRKWKAVRKELGGA